MGKITWYLIKPELLEIIGCNHIIAHIEVAGKCHIGHIFLRILKCG